MKILHVLSTFSVDYPGGITNYLRTLVQDQLTGGHQVDVVDAAATAGKWLSRPEGFRERGVAATQRAVHVVSTKVDQAGTDEFLALLSEEQYDVVHFHLTINMGTSLYSEMARGNTPYVVTLHDYFLFCPRITMMNWRGENCGGPERSKCETCVGPLDQIDVLYRVARKTGTILPRIGKSSMVTRRNTLISQFLLGARRVLAISHRVKELFDATYPGLDCQVAHVGTETAGTSIHAPTASENLRFTVLGTLSAHKGAAVLSSLIAAVQRTDVEYHFHGRVLDRVGRAVLAEGRIIDHGPYPPEELPEIMTQTDVGLVLSIWEEGAGLVAMEFLNHGRPVIATRRGGLPDFVNAGNGFLFEPSAEGITSAAAFIDALTPESLDELRGGIEKLTTPQEHAEVVMAAYG